MEHIRAISKKRAPTLAMSLLEKQAMTDMIERNVAQLAVVLNILAGLKAQQQDN